MAVQHVIVGGGPVATNAIETIRQFDDGKSQITLISDEPAHSRMALPYWLAGQIPREHTHTADAAYYKKFGVKAKIGLRADAIDPGAKTVACSDGTSMKFDTLLLATGSSPLGLPIPGADLPGVQPLWSLAHTDELLKATKKLKQPRVLMIGAGFIGFIMLNAMYKRGWKLTVVERERHVLPRMLDGQAASIVESWLAEKDVDVHAGAAVKQIGKGRNNARIVELADGTQLTADAVIVATGVRPNIELAKKAGLRTEEGILVNNHMETSAAGIFAGGDTAQGPDLLGGPAAIHAVQPTAVDHGRIAGANMAGERIAYPGSLSMNVLDVCGLQNASFGNWSDDRAETMTVANPDSYICRKLFWTEDRITGAIFVGRANDLGMLTDVGMVKGLIQTQTRLGDWKRFIRENPFDIRRPYVACNVAQKLIGTTLLGRPSQPRQFHFKNAKPQAPVGPAHKVFAGTKGK